MSASDPRAFWEDVYQTRRATSSGQPSAALVRVASGLTPGRALDLGSSNGDDVIWLAAQGWQALGVDISETACDRARQKAEALGLGGRARFEARDLSRGLPEGQFDLVTAFFLQSPVDLDRDAILRAAAERVAAGGHLLVLAHAAPPPWASDEMKARAHEMPTVRSELDAIGYTPGQWIQMQAEIVHREGRGPDGTTAQLQDTFILLQRRAD